MCIPNHHGTKLKQWYLTIISHKTEEKKILMSHFVSMESKTEGMVQI